MSAAVPWLVLPDGEREAPPSHPAGVRLTLPARAVLAAYWTFVPTVRREIRRGHAGSRLVSLAFEQLEQMSPAPLHLTRKERSSGIRQLIDQDARHGGLL